jgi:soluble lytic murein transglycosylase
MHLRRPLSGLCARALGGLLCFALWQTAIADINDMRQSYRSALEQLNDGHIDAFKAAMARLTDYPLYPYLEYQYYRQRLQYLSDSDARAFRDRWADSPIADRLYGEWLDDLAHRGAWEVYLRNYAPSADVARQCTYLRALDRSGEHTTAMAGISALWMVGTSQPKACDALFAIWIDRGLVTNGIVWDRLTLALQARQWDLARYLASLLSVAVKRQGELYYRVARDPALVRETGRFAADDEATRAIVTFGLRKLAAADPTAANAAWSKYSKTLSFRADDARVISQDITIGFARHGVVDAAADLTPSPDGRHLLVYEALILASINNKDWSAVAALIQRLDEPERAKQRWQYWLGRAQRALLEAPDDSTRTTEQPWLTLSNERQYYGFLAAESLEKAPMLNDQSNRPDEPTLATLRENAAMQRITEFYTLGDRTNARREWNALTARLEPTQRAAAAHVIAELGWVDQSIMAANSAELHDDLSLRFPTPFTPLFAKESRASGVPISFLYGIARQESAFGANARSSAGALGLMQLMPATAAMTARNIGDPAPVTAALFKPEVNIRIASRHLAELLQRFDGNRVLVAAAYNAGPHRVDRWLRERPARPADIWIESIPFAETRDYVKNVMAFSYIYGQRLGHPTQFLDADER